MVALTGLRRQRPSDCRPRGWSPRLSFSVVEWNGSSQTPFARKAARTKLDPMMKKTRKIRVFATALVFAGLVASVGHAQDAEH